MPSTVFAVDDLLADDVQALLAVHLAFSYEHSPPEDVHALATDGLLGPDITFLTGRRDGELVAMGALRELDDQHGELKSMHVVERTRGEGVGRALLDELLQLACARGYRRVSLETGSMDAYGPARAMYAAA